MTILMLARRAREQEAVFQRRGLGEPFGIQLAGKRLGIVGVGNIGTHPQEEEGPTTEYHCTSCYLLPQEQSLLK